MRGDFQGEFEGDYVAILSDSSGWKIHPEDNFKYENWSAGDKVRIMHTPGFVNVNFWGFQTPRIERLHRFILYNESRGEGCQAMFVQRDADPIRRIVAIDFIFNVAAKDKYNFSKKILHLSDGSFWMIKRRNKFNYFVVGASVYVGVQGTPNVDYDYILITGLGEKAIATRAKLLND